MVQLAPAVKLVPQVLAITNEDAFVPVTAMLPMPSVEVPVLVSVALFETLEEPTVSAPNARVVGDSVTVVGVTPVPLSVIVCGEFVALSVSVTEAASAP